MGTCLQIMECLEPVAMESFQALCDAFNFYLYHVFIWFGVIINHFFDKVDNKIESAFAKLADPNAGFNNNITNTNKNILSSPSINKSNLKSRFPNVSDLTKKNIISNTSSQASSSLNTNPIISPEEKSNEEFRNAAKKKYRNCITTKIKYTF